MLVWYTHCWNILSWNSIAFCRSVLKSCITRIRWFNRASSEEPFVLLFSKMWENLWNRKLCYFNFSMSCVNNYSYKKRSGLTSPLLPEWQLHPKWLEYHSLVHFHWLLTNHIWKGETDLYLQEVVVSPAGTKYWKYQCIFLNITLSYIELKHSVFIKYCNAIIIL